MDLMPPKNVYARLIDTLLPGRILAVQVGLSRTAVLAETDDGVRCGLAATLSNPDFEHRIRPAVRNAGHLHEMSPIDLAQLVDSDSFTEVAIGMAAINAMLPRQPERWVELKAENYINEIGSNKNVAVVGHLPFVRWLKSKVKKLWVLELFPREGDYPARAAPEIIPQADVVAITATTLINKTFSGLIQLCRPDASVILIGPSTPITPILYEFGVQILSGTVVTQPQAALLGVGQGVSLHQLRSMGCVRLVTLKKG